MKPMVCFVRALCCLSLSTLPLSQQFSPPFIQQPRRLSRRSEALIVAPPPNSSPPFKVEGLRHQMPIVLSPASDVMISMAGSLRATPKDNSEDVISSPPDSFSPPLIGVWVSVSLHRDGEDFSPGSDGAVGDDDTLANEIRSGAFGESHWVDDLGAWAVESESIHLLSARASALGWKEGTFTSGEYVSLRLLEWSPSVMEALGRGGISCAIERMQGLALVRESELDEVMIFFVAREHKQSDYARSREAASGHVCHVIFTNIGRVKEREGEGEKERKGDR